MVKEKMQDGSVGGIHSTPGSTTGLGHRHYLLGEGGISISNIGKKIKKMVWTNK